jgi:hypothetical protein
MELLSNVVDDVVMRRRLPVSNRTALLGCGGKNSDGQKRSADPPSPSSVQPSSFGGDDPAVVHAGLGDHGGAYVGEDRRGRVVTVAGHLAPTVVIRYISVAVDPVGHFAVNRLCQATLRAAMENSRRTITRLGVGIRPVSLEATSSSG